jgi:hypothetical protein
LEDDPVFFRIIFVPLSLLMLANCAGQVDPAKYALAERDTSAQRIISNNRQLAKMDDDYDRLTRNAMRDVPTVDVGKPIADIGFSRKNTPEERIIRDAEKSDDGIRGHIVRAAVTDVQPADSSSSAKNAKFLETLANDDKENQLLKRKTNICRGC